MKATLLFRRLAPVLAGSLLIGAAARAQDAIVPDDFSTIQSAVFGASDVDGNGTVEIFVRAGTYAENVFVRRSNLSLTGEDRASTRIQGGGLFETVRVQDSTGVFISGFTVTSVSGQDGIELQRTRGCTVSGNTLTQCRDGLEVNRSGPTTVTGNEAFGNLEAGIKLNRSTATLVMQNDCHDNGHQGIDLRRSDANVLRSNLTRNNIGDGIRVREATGNQVTANTSTGNGNNGFHLRLAIGNQVDQNTASGNLDNGLRMRDTAGNLISANTFVQNREFGVRRRRWQGDDFDMAQSGAQDPPGDNDLSGNVKGMLRND